MLMEFLQSTKPAISSAAAPLSNTLGGLGLVTQTISQLLAPSSKTELQKEVQLRRKEDELAAQRAAELTLAAAQITDKSAVKSLTLTAPKPPNPTGFRYGLSDLPSDLQKNTGSGPTTRTYKSSLLTEAFTGDNYVNGRLHNGRKVEGEEATQLVANSSSSTLNPAEAAQGGPKNWGSGREQTPPGRKITLYNDLESIDLPAGQPNSNVSSFRCEIFKAALDRSDIQRQQMLNVA